MAEKTTLVMPSDLVGPRSFFTDLDPSDSDYRPEEVVRKLKLQLLTKQRVVIAASSLYHDVGYDVFQQAVGLDALLQEGVILPAIRDQFSEPSEFFRFKPEYPTHCADYFCSHTTHFLSWPLSENSHWFTHKMLEGVEHQSSLLRQRLGLTVDDAEHFLVELEQETDCEPDKGFLTRRKVDKVAGRFTPSQQALIGSYADLIYRISGTRVVNCEGHFPHSNLTRFKFAGNEERLSEETVFWDVYVEAIVSYLNSAIRITPERLDRLSFGDIRKIRDRLSLKDFSEVYDSLISNVKQGIEIDDPDRAILRQEEIMTAAEDLRKKFEDRVRSEIGEPDSTERASRLWELANVLALVSSPAVGLIVGCLSAMKAIPEITGIWSPTLAESLEQRRAWLEKYITQLGWTGANKRSMIDSYRELVKFGI